MEKGWRQRSTGATLMNADSSRSHCIFSVALEMMDASKAPACTAPAAPSEEAAHIRRGKLNLVDLAGSERQAKTGEINAQSGRLSSPSPSFKIRLSPETRAAT